MESAPALRLFEDHQPRPMRGRAATRNASRAVLAFPEPATDAVDHRARALVLNDPHSSLLEERIRRIAPTAANVLITGETGTGKELAARHVHALSGRSGPFVAVNCGGFSEGLIDAEFFGHEAGAFTGALQSRAGWFEAATGGTLFLDEIGDLPLPLQVKLLRVLQERQVVRIGARRAIPVDVRLVAATNVDLARAVAAGNFRMDLYYRLNVACLELPPLRERRGDIRPLAEYFLARFAQQLGRGPARLEPSALRRLEAHDWPGNIRELENVIQCGLIVADAGVVTEQDLRIPARADATGSAATPGDGLACLAESVDSLIDSEAPDLLGLVIQTVLQAGLDRCGGNQVRAAACLGITRNRMRSYMKRFSLAPG